MSNTKKPLFNFSITQSIHFEPILSEKLKTMIIERIAQEQPDVVITDVEFVNKRSTGIQAEVVGHLKGLARNDIKTDSNDDLAKYAPAQTDLVETIEKAVEEEEAVEAPAVSSLLSKINLGTEEPKTVSSLFDK